MALTREDIVAAAEQLQADGKSVTIAEVRKVLGSGSYTTISDVIRDWRAEQSKPTTPIKEAAPSAVVERLESLGADIWAVALGLANDRLRAEREALELARAEMEQQQQETADMADQLAAEIEQLRAERDTMLHQVEVSRLAEESSRQMWALEQDENIKLTAQLQGMQSELEAARSRIEQDRQALVEYAERDKVQAVEIERLRIAVDNARRAEEHQVRRADAAIEGGKAAQSVAQAAQVEAAKLSGELEVMREQLRQQADLLRAAVQQPKASSKQQPRNNNGKQS